ncbi:cupin domain-containing protein [Halobellus rufus]|uniref:cupin domain-containing protein n=1 Tax=Halobellus rufus TaxID=1448860 RepID=UPI000678AD5B|nr:cupin domain-containing protein [Halobellus rufus]
MATVESLSALEGDPHAAVFPGAEPKTVRLSLDADERIAPHTHPGRDIVFYVVDGAVDLDLDDETHSLDVGDVARFAGEREISPVAREPSTALLVLARRADD